MVDDIININDRKPSDNRGFSIVELIVCVAILAIAMIPLYQSMSLSSRTNAKAQSLQNATSLAESVMEEIKSSSIEDLKIKYNGVDAEGLPIEVPLGTISETDFFNATVENRRVNGSSAAAASSKLLTGSAGTPPKPFFVLYKHNAVSTQGEEFDVLATMRSSTYMLDENPKASDANSKKLPKIEEIDTLSQAVISNKEFLKYDKAAEDFFKQNTYDACKKIVSKEIFIDKTDNDPDGPNYLISVNCRVVYKDNTEGTPHTYSRELFSGSFNAPEGWDKATPVVSNIYLFFKRSELGIPEETITVKDITQKAEHKVYFLFEPSVEGASHVIDGTGLSISIANGSGNLFTVIKNSELTGGEGNRASGDYELITNLDYKDAGVDKKGHIYKQEAGIRIYDVNVALYKDEKFVTSIESTKEVKNDGK